MKKRKPTITGLTREVNDLKSVVEMGHKMFDATKERLNVAIEDADKAQQRVDVLNLQVQSQEIIIAKQEGYINGLHGELHGEVRHIKLMKQMNRMYPEANYNDLEEGEES